MNLLLGVTRTSVPQRRDPSASMKLATGVLVLAAAVVAYRPGEEYLYRYEADLHSLLPALPGYRAGIRLSTDARMQIGGLHAVTMRLENPDLCKVDHEVPSAETLETITEHSCTPFTGPEANVIKRELIRPYSFSWDSGLVSELRVDAEEPYWSVNIKRGLLNVLQLNIEERDVIENLSPEMRDMMPNIPYRTGELHQLFRAYENDLVGECETLYAVMEDDVIATDMHVSKVRNYEHCRTRSSLHNGLLTVLKDPDAKAQNSLLAVTSHADYTLSGTRDLFFIKEATVATSFLFTPFDDHEKQAASTHTRQTLHLLSAAYMVSPTETTLHLVPRNVLVFDMPLSNSQTRENDLHEIPSAQLSIIHTLLDEALPLTRPEAESSMTDKLAELSELLRVLPVATLKEVIRSYTTQSNDADIVNKREILLDVLPSLNHPNTVEIIRELLEQGVITPMRAVYMTNLMALTITPTLQAFDEVMSWVRALDTAERQRQLRDALVLTSGVLADKIKSHHQNIGPVTHHAISETYRVAQSLTGLVDSHRDLRAQLAGLRAMANAGFLEFLPTLETMIREETQPLVIRVKAIFALEKLAPVIPMKIQDLLLPLYLNLTVPKDIRIASFLITMKTRPSLGVLQFVTHQLKRESSLDIVYFVYSYLETLADNDDPTMQDMSTWARQALLEIQPMYPGLGSSKFMKFNPVLSFLGSDIEMILWNNGLSPVPNILISRISALFSQQKINLFEFAIENEGIAAVLLKLLGPENRLGDILSGSRTLNTIRELLRPIARVLSPHVGNTDHIQNAFDSDTRHVSGIRFHAYVNLFSYQLAPLYTAINGDDIIRFIDTLQADVTQLLLWLRSGVDINKSMAISLLDSGIVLPTTLGIPLSLNISTVTLAGIHGNIQMGAPVNIFQLYQTNSPPLNISTTLLASFASKVTIAMGAQLPYLKTKLTSNLTAHARIPIRASLQVDTLLRTLTIHTESPQPGDVIASVAIMPATSFHTTGSIVGMPFYSEEDTTMFTAPTEVYSHPLSLLFSDSLTLRKSAQQFMRFPWMSGGLQSWELIYSPSAGIKKHHEIMFIYLDHQSTMHANGSASYYEDITPHSGIAPSSLQQIVMRWKVKEGPMEHSMAAKLAHMSSSSQLKHQFNIQAVKHDDGAVTKVVFDGILHIPPFIFSTASDLPLSTKELFSSINVRYMCNSRVTSAFSHKLFYGRQRGFDVSISTPVLGSLMKPVPLEAMFPYMYNNRSILGSLLKVQGAPVPINNTPLIITNEIEYNTSQFHPLISQYLRKMYHTTILTPRQISKDISVTRVPVTNEPDKAIVQVTVMPAAKEIQLTIDLPKEKTTIKAIHLPFPFVFEESNGGPVYKQISKHLLYGRTPEAKCQLTSDGSLLTYDLKMLQMPYTACAVVLTKDCSHSHLYMVTARHIPGTNKKNIHIYLPDYNIELGVRSSFWHGDQITINVNNQSVDVSESRPYEIINPHNRAIFLRITKYGDGVLVDAKHVGLVVITDLIEAEIKSCELFRSILCGLCGDFNLDLEGELRGPHMEVYQTTVDYVNSYSLGAPECNSSISQQHTGPAQNRRSQHVCGIVYRNVHIEHVLDNISYSCFSNPLPHCPAECQAGRSQVESEPFYCMPQFLPITERLRQDIDEGPMEFQDQPVHLHSDVVRPLTCISNSP